MIPVKVDQLFLSNVGFVVLLKGVKDERCLPIFIGAAEAQAIAIQINDVKVPRPLTHDLLKNVLDCLECRVRKIEVCDLKEGTFFARLVLDRGGDEVSMDTRPSDAIALALRCSAPIFVAEKVMDEAGNVFDKSNVSDIGKKSGSEKEGQASDRKLSPAELLKRDLEKAIKEERYEDAAGLRDEMKRLEDPHAGN